MYRYYRYCLEADIQCPEKLHDLHNDLPFLAEKIKIQRVEKLVANFRDKKEYVIRTKYLKGVLLKKSA